MQEHAATIHGRHLSFRTAGDSGPVVVMIHGITQDARTWTQLSRHLEDELQLVALDLPGHGKSENPPGDHSMGAYASTVRDLMLLLGHSSATLVGHSLGGGIALQFAYQFPEMTQRLVLIDSGGLGVEVSSLLRAAALPGADPVIAMLSTDSVKQAAGSVARGLERLGLRFGTDVAEVWRGLDNLGHPTKRHAFLRTVRGAIGLGGQRISAQDKLYLAEHVPTLLIWGARDRIIPLTHATDAHEAIPGSRLRVVREAGHFPHLDAPRTVARYLEEFVRETQAASVPREEWGQLLKAERLETA